MSKAIDWTKPVQTRDGRKVRVLCTDGPKRSPVIGIVDGNTYPSIWDGKGKNASSATDLINVPEKRVVWVNMYPGDHGSYGYDEKAIADDYCGLHREACIRVEYEVGQFDE